VSCFPTAHPTPFGRQRAPIPVLVPAQPANQLPAPAVRALPGTIPPAYPSAQGPLRLARPALRLTDTTSLLRKWLLERVPLHLPNHRQVTTPPTMPLGQPHHHQRQGSAQSNGTVIPSTGAPSTGAYNLLLNNLSYDTYIYRRTLDLSPIYIGGCPSYRHIKDVSY
jgi:hypothetical protein